MKYCGKLKMEKLKVVIKLSCYFWMKVNLFNRRCICLSRWRCGYCQWRSLYNPSCYFIHKICPRSTRKNLCIYKKTSIVVTPSYRCFFNIQTVTLSPCWSTVFNHEKYWSRLPRIVHEWALFHTRIR